MSYDKVGWDLCNVVNQNLCHKQHVSIEYVLSNSFSQLKKKKQEKGFIPWQDYMKCQRFPRSTCISWRSKQTESSIKFLP